MDKILCPNCGAEIDEDALVCSSCQENLEKYFSGGEKEQVPDASKVGSEPAPAFGFNWAAFLITPIWLLGHKMWLWFIGYIVVYLLSMAVPIVRILYHTGVATYLGIKGNSILWNSNRYASAEELKKKERRWAIVGIILSILGIGFMFLLLQE